MQSEMLQKSFLKNAAKSRLLRNVTKVTKKNGTFINRLKKYGLPLFYFSLYEYLGKSCNIVTF